MGSISKDDREEVIQAWYMDDSDEDQRLPHHRNPEEFVSLEKLAELGVLSWRLDADNYETDEELKKIRESRGYSYIDFCEVCPEKLPNYEEKIKNFFEEHLHTDEEIRYCVAGSGYFDVRDHNDGWIRVCVKKGGMIVLPAGIYHRFTLDTDNYIKVRGKTTETLIDFSKPFDSFPQENSFTNIMAHLLNNNNDDARQVLNPVGPVPAAGNRNFVAERDHEMRQDHAAANDRFKVRKRAVNLPHKPANAGIENSIFSTAANYPPIRAVYPSLSYFIPNFKSTLYYVNVMDCLMASTKSWTDDCLGWVPPYSQMYISVLLYIQVMRAMEAAGALRPNSDLSVLLREFRDTFPLENLMIPGPLVCLFQNLTSFWPFASGRFGNVTPFLPNSPGWSQERQFCFSDTICSVLPNISLFFSRLHSTLSLVEYDDLTEEEFRNHVQGPSHLGFLFERPCDANEFEMSNMCSPGADLSYPGSLRLWREAHQQLNNFDIPEDFNVDETVVNDNWTAALRFDENMQWFSPIVNMMDKYCRFFHGSVALSECTPDGSAAGSIICTAYPDSTLLMPPQWYEDAGGRTSRTHGDPNCIGHYTLRSIPTLEFTASTCIEDIPDANVLAALTYQFNLQRLGFADADALQGRFWNVIPNTYEKTHIDVFQGVIATIAREFHSNVQL